MTKDGMFGVGKEANFNFNQEGDRKDYSVVKILPSHFLNIKVLTSNAKLCGAVGEIFKIFLT